jgi:thermosome
LDLSSPTQAGGVPILVMKEGTSRSRGKEAQHTNITAAKIVGESVRSALGPKGMDKMLVDNFGDVTITNDGRTILDEMDVQNPAAKMMVDVAKAQDNEAGDGTTSAVIIAGELLSKGEELLNMNVHPTVIIDGYKLAEEKALATLDQIALPIDISDTAYLKKAAITALGSKLVAEHKEYLADLVVKAMLTVAEKSGNSYKADVDDVLVEKKTGDSLKDTSLINGIVIDKEIVHSGMPKRIEKAKIALLDVSLENEKTEYDAKLNIESPEQIQAFLSQEDEMLRALTNKIVAAGANFVICQKGIDDLVQHFLARKGVAAIRRAKKSDMERLAKATGGNVVSNIDALTAKDLGEAALVEERKIAEDKMVFIEGCKKPKAVTILIRGSSPRMNRESERSIHDGLCVVRDLIREPKIVAGGSAPELEMAKEIRKFAESQSGREQLAIKAFADALDILSTTLTENAGLNPIDILAELRSRHDKGETWAGVEVLSGKVQDMTKAGIFEPVAVKKQIIKSASEAAMMILKIDDVIAAQKMTPPPGGPGMGGMGMGGMGGPGMGMGGM